MEKPYRPEKLTHLEMVCEPCGELTTQFEITDDGQLFCRDCVDAEKRRARFRNEEEEWNMT